MIKTYVETRYFDPYAVPFYVEDISGQGGTFNFNDTYIGDATNFEFSNDKQNWTSVIPSSLSSNSRIYIRANASYYGLETTITPLVNSSNNFIIGGNVLSLFYGSSFTGSERVFPDITKSYILSGKFGSLNKLVSAEHLLLPATTLATGCYRNMFWGCSNLTAAPELPATTLVDTCYNSMFYGCSSLTAAPALPATILANQCYKSMFSGCTNITTAPELPATNLATECYQTMFYGCTSLTVAPELPATTLARYCYSNMFNGCTSLTAAPELPATTFVYQCYSSMFNGCTSLSSVSVGATSWDTSYTTNWLNNVSATGTFTKPANTSIPEGTSGIPANWTVINV